MKQFCFQCEVSHDENWLHGTCRHQLLSDDDLGPLYDLLIDEPSEIRRAIGALVYDHLIAQTFSSSRSGSKGTFFRIHYGIFCVQII